MAEASEKSKMLSGTLYRATDPELIAGLRRAQELMRVYNATGPEELDAREEVLRQLLGEIGENVQIRPTFACDYGVNIRIGRNVFVNYNCVFLDCARITIGDDVQIGPCV